MAKTKFIDSAGREAYKDDSGKVYTEGGKRDTYYNVDEWNKRQSNKYGSSSQSGLGGYDNPAIQSALNMQMSAIQPVIESKQAQITPLKQRYDDLINQIKGQGQVAEDRTQLATSQELGRRGILTSSGLGEKTITSALNPVTLQTQGKIADAGYQRESQIQAINDAIAQLKSGASQNALSYVQQQEAQAAADARTAQSNPTLSDRIKEIQSLDKELGLGLFGGSSTTTFTEPAPQYTPAGGEGTTVGSWVYRNGQWTKVGEKASPDSILSQFGY